ncbi:hypothetical protein KSP40_PGU007121 [Platanthera guangdongensis]|uniref:Reticulon domain-containing protein n=1 Tax=Platanthera guangdongensis TaxID=2320717 RepID=A0ABR2MKI2_9ASPA
MEFGCHISVSNTLLWKDKKQTLTSILLLAAIYYYFFASGYTLITAVAKLLSLSALFLFVHGLLEVSFCGGLAGLMVYMGRLSTNSGSGVSTGSGKLHEVGVHLPFIIQAAGIRLAERNCEPACGLTSTEQRKSGDGKLAGMREPGKGVAKLHRRVREGLDLWETEKEILYFPIFVQASPFGMKANNFYKAGIINCL